MNRPLVKICGITNIDDAMMSLEYGADMLGFIFYDKSPRFIVPEKAARIISGLKDRFKFESVGVFVDPLKEYIDDIINITGIDMLQFHGDESPEFIGKFRKKIIKAFRIKDRQDLIKLNVYDSAGFYLLDTYSKNAYGGTGKAFDWEILKDIDFSEKLFLSGGLNSSNIEDALRKVNPYAVDLSSSLEKSPGVKDRDKIKEFFSVLNRI